MDAGSRGDAELGLSIQSNSSFIFEDGELFGERGWEGCVPCRFCVGGQADFEAQSARSDSKIIRSWRFIQSKTGDSVSRQGTSYDSGQTSKISKEEPEKSRRPDRTQTGGGSCSNSNSINSPTINQSIHQSTSQSVPTWYEHANARWSAPVPDRGQCPLAGLDEPSPSGKRTTSTKS